MNAHLVNNQCFNTHNQEPARRRSADNAGLTTRSGTAADARKRLSLKKRWHLTSYPAVICVKPIRKFTTALSRQYLLPNTMSASKFSTVQGRARCEMYSRARSAAGRAAGREARRIAGCDVQLALGKRGAGKQGEDRAGRTRPGCGCRRKTKTPGRLQSHSGVPKNGSYLLSHLVGQYHRRWRA